MKAPRARGARNIWEFSHWDSRLSNPQHGLVFLPANNLVQFWFIFITNHSKIKPPSSVTSSLRTIPGLGCDNPHPAGIGAWLPSAGPSEHMASIGRWTLPTGACLHTEGHHPGGGGELASPSWHWRALRPKQNLVQQEQLLGIADPQAPWAEKELRGRARMCNGRWDFNYLTEILLVYLTEMSACKKWSMCRLKYSYSRDSFFSF